MTRRTHLRRTKLVCTIGPASVGRAAALVAAGMDVARLNFSHGTAAARTRAADAVRAAAGGADRPVAILADLAGPKIRLGPLEGDEQSLVAGRPYTLWAHGGPLAGDATGARVTYPRLGRSLRPGDRVLLADGAAELRVIATRGDAVETEVVLGGTIRSRAGVSVPSERLAGSGLTRKPQRIVAGLPAEDSLASSLCLSFTVEEAANPLGGLLGWLGRVLGGSMLVRGALGGFLILGAFRVMRAKPPAATTA